MYEGASCSEGGAVREQRARLLEPGWAPAVRGVCVCALASRTARSNRTRHVPAERRIVSWAEFGLPGPRARSTFGPYCLCRHVWMDRVKVAR
jgi:hypothetical protein